ncbi:MAG TPA: D-Ala-D-Ala carboxypeptidase family metallohydrolase [Kofleriaceae bacterium]|jgi:peptidoglycan hydrolase-like protein with peptidoglycan-binding domain|nr:D-Ala-D-Ala carboxypeptidase family metallohydrolase [Kofleriaceae bacterium]
MDQREQTPQDPQHDQTPAKAPAQEAGGVTNHHPGGKDALGNKENVLAPFYDQMVEVAHELAPQFTPLGLHFRPEILLATAMQEASSKDPATTRSFDNGLGIMQITPYKGKLDPGVAKAINWDNSKDVEFNVQHSNWRSVKPNLTAGAQTMLGKARSIKGGVPSTWEQMDEPHRWRAVLYAYNAGEGSAISALRRGGPNASMISTFKDPSGKTVSHDYTAEIKGKMDYVDGHDPFAAGGKETPSGPAAGGGGPSGGGGAVHETPHTDGIQQSVGRGGVNARHDVIAVQTRLKQRGVDPQGIDGDVGPHTIQAIETFQATFLPHPDGLISNNQTSEKHLFDETGKISATPPAKPKAETGPAGSKDPGAAKDEHQEKPGEPKEAAHPQYEAIAKNFNTAIPGSSLTWHQALFLPSWGRHAKPSDVTNTSMDTALANIEKQAAALQKVSDHFGKAIHVHCWLRPPAYNKQIGGASNSAHLRGTATDFHMDGITAEAVRKELKAHPNIYPGAGENNVSWVHIDLEHHAWFNP